MIYHIGYLPIDREPRLRAQSTGAADAMLIDRAASNAYSEWELGKVHLMQKRLGPFVYEYHAIPIKGRHEPRRNARGAQQAPSRGATAPSAG